MGGGDPECLVCGSIRAGNQYKFVVFFLGGGHAAIGLNFSQRLQQPGADSTQNPLALCSPGRFFHSHGAHEAGAQVRGQVHRVQGCHQRAAWIGRGGGGD